MAAAGLLRSLRRMDLTNSSLAAHKALAGNIESTYPISQGVALARLFSSKPSGNEVMDKQKEGAKALIGIKVTSFDGRFMGIPPHTKKVGLPESRVVYTVLRSPHIDKKSREQFEMRIMKLYLVIKTDSHEPRNKYFWLKRQLIFGAQFEINFSCKTRLEKAKLDGLLGR